MPPVIRYTHDTVLSAAFTLVRRDGISAFNARSVAQELGSSTQPIFRLFSGMDELRAGVIELAGKAMQDYMLKALEHSDSPYLTMGLSYVRFAREEPELFKLLYMSDISIDLDKMRPFPDEIIDEIQKEAGISAEQARALHGWLWIFTHGMAVSFATKACCMCDERLERIMRGAYEAAMLKLRQDIENGVI